MKTVPLNYWTCREEVRDDGIDCSNDVPLTKQSELQESDINFLMSRYERTGLLPEMIRKDPRYGDFSDPVSYQDSLNLVQHAQEQFDSLDAHIRKRFGNDPAEFLAFAEDPSNAGEMVRMGLATARPTLPPSQLSPIPPEPSSGVKKRPKDDSPPADT